MTERILLGRPAAPGLGSGPVVRLEHKTPARIPSGDPVREAAALAAAIEEGIAALSGMIEAAEGDAAEILGFQVALLSDDELGRPAFESIAKGAAADIAWRNALDSEIETYRSAEDDYFRARTADLEDLRDRVLLALSGHANAPAITAGAVALAHDLPPSRFLSIDWSKGGAIVLSGGSAMSHVAMLARSRGVPMVVGLGVASGAFRQALVDGSTGRVVFDPSELSRRAFEAEHAEEQRLAMLSHERVALPAATRDGVPIAVHVNIADPSELDTLDPAHCDGIGLVRTEFMFHDKRELPDEETQYRVYRRLAEWSQGRPVTIRTLDAGGDKPVPGLTVDGESNPFLGVRGIRLSLARPDVFRVQLRALARAAVHGAIQVMLPMVTVPSELEAARVMMAEESRALAQAGFPVRIPELGIMVEVPAAAISIDRFEAAFFSIGSNDLTQYVTAAGRDIGDVAELADPLNPAVLRLIAGIAAHGRSTGISVSLCGDAGSDPTIIPHLLAAGLRSVSVPPARLARTKAEIGKIDLSSLKAQS